VNLTETITWIPVSQEKPDDETTVIGFNARWDETEDMWHEDGCWRWAGSAMTCEPPPTHWAHKPGGPKESEVAA
jgi:hypothetical protein